MKILIHTDHDDGNMPGAEIVLEELDCLHPVHPGHLKIGKDQVGAKINGLLAQFHPVMHRSDLITGVIPGQCFPDILQICLGVIAN
mgnify:FL=1